MTPDIVLILLGLILITLAAGHTLLRLFAAKHAADTFRPTTRPQWLGVDRQGRWVGGPVSDRTLWWRVFVSRLRTGRP